MYLYHRSKYIYSRTRLVYYGLERTNFTDLPFAFPIITRSDIAKSYNGPKIHLIALYKLRLQGNGYNEII